MKQEHITSRQNPLLVHIRKLASSRSYRKTCGEFVAEGTKLLEEAAKWWPDLRTVVCREDVPLRNLPDTVPEGQLGCWMLYNQDKDQAFFSYQ